MPREPRFQVARKSTGAPAPRFSLAQAQEKAKKISEVKRSLVSARSQQPEHKAQRKPDDSSNISITINPCVPTQVLTVHVLGPIYEKADMDNDHDKWCTACQNGGDCICCSTCQRAVCSKCITVEDDVEGFVCPSCHLKKQRLAPYMVKGKPIIYSATISNRESFLRCVAEPLAVISITLQGMMDGPGKIVYDYLHTYLQGNVAYIHLDFNFDSVQDTDSFLCRLNTLIDLFEIGGDLHRFRRFAVFLSTHSEPDRGDLHIAPNNQASASVGEVFHQIFGGTRFGELLCRSRDSVLVLVSCGAVVAHPEPLEALRHFSSQQFFRQIMAFTEPDLLGSPLSSFLLDYSRNRFIHNKDKVIGYINHHPILGAHTGVLLFDLHPATATHLFWSHAGRRPFGHHPPVQCTSCLSLMPWKSSTSQDGCTITHKCKGCGVHSLYKQVPHATLVDPNRKPGDRDSRGFWWYKSI